VINRISE